MVRIAEKGLSVNTKILNSTCDKDSQCDTLIFDPGWGKVHTDPVTGQLAEYYDHVLRVIKLNGGIQLWFYTPRYKLTEGSHIFRVLPSNLCEYKQYAVEIIQDVINEELEDILTEKQPVEEEIEGQLNGDRDAEERPCERTRWLWILWFYRNMLLIESVLRMLHIIHSTISAEGEAKLEAILRHTDYLLDLRTEQPDDWLKVIIQAAWNSGRPFIPLRGMETMRELGMWIKVQPISE